VSGDASKARLSKFPGEHAVRLEKPDSGHDTFKLVMSPVEWEEIHALAKFAQAGLAYDCKAAYVAQVFTYLVLWGRFGGFPQPADIQSNQDMQAAFAAVDRLAESVATGAMNRGDVVLRLRKEELRQLLIMLGKASEAEDHAEVMLDAYPAEFPYIFPDLEFTPSVYGDAFETLLMALWEDRSQEVIRPPAWRIRKE
jgi:hypothetical protein